jgi:AcrR family transcriptional regulator
LAVAARGQTRQKILDSARELFQRQGYHATGLNQVLAEGGAPKGSLYFHFPGGKEQLAAEAVTLSARQLRETLVDLTARAPDIPTAVRTIAEVLGARLEASDFRSGCPIATVALEAASDSSHVRQACADGYRGWLDVIASRLRAEGMDNASASELALLTLSAIEGALLLARVERDITPLGRVADRVAGLITRTSAGR